MIIFKINLPSLDTAFIIKILNILSVYKLVSYGSFIKKNLITTAFLIPCSIEIDHCDK